MLCPSDCYKIWKKENRIRIDTSLIGFDKLRWLRGNVTYLFIIEPDASSFYLLDHDKKLWQHVKKLSNFTDEEVEKDLNLRLNQEIVSGRVDSRRPISFSRSRTLMGLGDEMVEAIGHYKSKVYSIENLEWVTRTRKEHLRDRPEGDLSEQTSSWFLGYGGRTAYSHIKRAAKEQKQVKAEEEPIESDSVETLYRESIKEIRDALTEAEDLSRSDVTGIADHLPDFDPHKIDTIIDDATALADYYTPSLPPPKNRADIPFEEYFPAVGVDANELAALPYIHMGRKLAVKEQRKKLSASIWMSHDFPLTIEQLLPLFEILSPSNEHFDKLREFISLQLPPGFPVQVELPVLMFLSARITFRNYKTWTKESRRTIPIPSAADPQNSSKKWFEIPEDYTEGIVIKSIFKKYEDAN
jgi:ankyrin repeat domain-containing protein 13